MAFNPSPEVAAARDYATKFDKDMVIIIHIEDVGDKGYALGFASFGKTLGQCSGAKTLGDLAYNAIADYLAG